MSQPTLAPAPPRSSRTSTADEAVLVRSSMGWDDPRILEAALRPGTGSRILSLDASGDSAFAMLVQGAGEVTFVTASPAQHALVELKRAALLGLGHDELARFLGVMPGSDRAALYMRVRPLLSADARTYWDAHPLHVARGVLHAGRLEQGLQLLRLRVLPLLHGPRTRRLAFEPRSRLAREVFWHDRWDNRRWRAALRLLTSQQLLAHLDVGPSGGDLPRGVRPGDVVTARAFHAFVELDPTTNPFLQQVLLGRFLDLRDAPTYLDPEQHELLRERMERLALRREDVDGFLATCGSGCFTGIAASDVLARTPGGRFVRRYRALARAVSRDGAIAWWEGLVPRGAPQSLLDSGAVRTDDASVQRLRDVDRSILRGRLHVDHVTDPEAV